MSLILHLTVWRDLKRRINEHVKILRSLLRLFLRFEGTKPMSWFPISYHVNMIHLI